MDENGWEIIIRKLSVDIRNNQLQLSSDRLMASFESDSGFWHKKQFLYLDLL